MSSLVTWVPGLHSPWASVPGWHACVNAPTTTTSPLTYAVPYTSDWQLFPPLPNQVLLHCVWPTVVPAETFGVNATGPWPIEVGQLRRRGIGRSNADGRGHRGEEGNGYAAQAHGKSHPRSSSKRRRRPG